MTPAATAAASEPEPSASRHVDAASGLSTAAQQPAAIPAVSVLVERFIHLFLTGEDGPVATADGGVAKAATIELVLAVRDAVDGLWKQHAAAIKQRCEPFMPQNLIAKQEVFRRLRARRRAWPTRATR